MELPNDLQRLRKPKSSCTECRRRKQRCNRIWPCNHCTKRNIGHLCHFMPVSQKAGQATVKKHLYGKASGLGECMPGHKVLRCPDGVCHDPSSSMKWCGYLKGLGQFNLSGLNTPAEDKKDDTISYMVDDSALQLALRALPGRSLTDELVRHYLQDGNMQYYTVHPPSFLRDYDKFWSTRTQSPNQASPAFTCLLLQICSNASQRLHTPLKRRLEYDLTESHVQTSKRLFEAAESLCRALSPGVQSVEKILRFLLAAAWLKSEGQIVDAWHALSIAVREAQECGLDRDDTLALENRMEVEIRRRIWCFIVVWDWQMAEWLSRPMLVNTTCKASSPNHLVDCSDDDRPSPILNLSEQFKLVHTVSSRFGRLSEIRNWQVVKEVLDVTEEWRYQLPKELSISDADLSWDDQCPWLPLQRAQLHSFAQMLRLTPLKQFLTSSPQLAASIDWRRMAVQACVDCVNAAMRLAEIMNPIRMPFHFVIFALFDTGTLICSAFMHEGDRYLPDHDRLLGSVKEVLPTLEAMSNDAVSARRSAEILRWLLRRVESIKGESLTDLASTFPARGESSIDAAATPVFVEVTTGQEQIQQPQLLLNLSPNEQSSSVPSDLLSSLDKGSMSAFGSVEVCRIGDDENGDDNDGNDNDASWLCEGHLGIQDWTDLDLGGMESIWDWEALGIDHAL